MTWSLKLPPPHDAQVASSSVRLAGEPQLMTSTDAVRPSTSKDALLPEYFSSRAHNQLSYFALGTALFASSVFLSRRAVVRRMRMNRPAGLFSSSRTLPQVNGAADAASALALATLNVGTFGAMLAGGSMWALDLRTVQDLRRYVRRGGIDTRQIPGLVEPEEKEDDIEAWMTFFSNSIQGKTDLLPQPSSEKKPKV